MQNKITCSDILHKIYSEKKHLNIQYVFIFDIDDTIFDTSYRRFFIYEKFLRKEFKLPRINFYLQKKHYNFIPLLEKDSIFQEKYYKILDRYYNLFLSESFLILDKPYCGIKSFLQSLNWLKIPILFLTGRYSPNLKTATQYLLKKYDLISPQMTNFLFMKPNMKISDKNFKKLELNSIINLYPERKIIIFDNESENCEIFNEILPKNSTIIRFNSVQRKICQYRGFLLENWI